MNQSSMKMQATPEMGMMINALEYARKLREAGVDQDLAEAQADALTNALQHAAEYRLATKDDMNSMKEEIFSVRQDITLLDHKIDQVESRLELKIEKLENRLSNKMFYLSASTVTILAALMTILHFH